MTLWSAIYDCVEVHDTRKEMSNLTGGPEAFVSLQCDYDIRHELAADLMRNCRWPFSPAGKTQPRPFKISINPLPTDYDEDGQTIVYKKAQLDVEFGFDNSAGSEQSPEEGGPGGSGRQYYTESFEPQLEIISVPDRKFYWLQANPLKAIYLDEQNIPSYRQYTFGIQRTFYNWMFVPISFKTFIGACNDAQVVFPTLGLTFEAEELLFVPQNAVRTISSEGTEGFTVSVLFNFKRGGWNKFVNPNGELDSLWYATDSDPQVEFKPHLLRNFSGWIF